jgi:hypothetical protein
MKATRSYIEAITTALSDNGKVTFKEGNGWQTNVESKVVEFNPHDLQQLDSNTVKGLLLHETGHVKYTQPVKASTIAEANKSMDDVYNVLEDIRIEKKLIDDYGAYANEGLEANIANTMITRKKEYQDGSFNNKPKLHQLLLSMLGENYGSRYDDNPEIEDGNYQIQHRIDQDVKERIQKIDSRKFIRKALDAKSTQEIKELADNELYPLIKDYIEQANNAPEPMHRPKPKPGASLRGNGKNIAQIPSDGDLDLLLSPYINTLAKRLDDVLKEKKSTRFTGNFKHGKLLSKNAFKVLTDETRIFSKKTNPDKPHYAVTMVLDESGSMQGIRHENTYIASYLIKKACQKLQFPIKFIKLDSTAQFIGDSMEKYRTHFRGGGNNEVTALQAVEKHTDPREDNLVFMMTDGGCGNDPKPLIRKMEKNGNYMFIAVAVGLSTKDEAEYIEILRRNYPITVTAEQVDQLPRIMIELLRKIIHR